MSVSAKRRAGQVLDGAVGVACRIAGIRCRRHRARDDRGGGILVRCGVRSNASTEGIGAGPADQDVVAVLAEKIVSTCKAEDLVVAEARNDAVLAGIACQEIGNAEPVRFSTEL